MLCLSLIALAAARAAAAPQPLSNTTVAQSTSYATLGPLPYGELKAEVAKLQASKRELGKRICEGVYLCDGFNFTGMCYYACYPISTAIVPDPYWVANIKSVGPDSGGVCYCSSGNQCDAGTIQIFEYPGGNLDPPVLGDMGCFYCNPIA